MTDQQPEALRLATVLENKLGGAADEDIEAAAAELRRLHSVNEQLLEALGNLEEYSKRMGNVASNLAANQMPKHLNASYEGDDLYTGEQLRAAVAAEREALIALLKGIDQTETESPDGWWETSTGADFGAGILAAIRARGEKK